MPASHLPFSEVSLAGAWAEALVRRLLHTAVRTPGGQWLAHGSEDAPVRVLALDSALMTRIARIQQHLRTARGGVR